MPFSDLLEQESARRTLQSALKSRQIPGALLFHGPWGVGKTRAALLFARALNCETRDDDACETCPSCKRARAFTHRNIQFIFPAPGGKPAEVEEAAARERAAYAADPYHVLESERFASISIDRVREVKRLAALGLAEGRAKVFVLREADRMLEVQQNSLLKLLEEPPPHTHLVLTSSRPQALLPTVVSRCTGIPFERLGRETIEAALVEARGLGPPEAREAAAMADGSLGRALLGAGEAADLVRLGERALAIVVAAEAGGPRLLEAAAALAAEKDRSVTKRLAHALALWYGDVLRVRAGGEPRTWGEDGRREPLAADARRLDLPELRRRIDLCEALIEAVDGNANLALAAYWFLVSLRDPGAARLEEAPLR